MTSMCVASVLLLISADEDAVGAVPSTLTRQERELANLQLHGMKDSRDRLTSGVFRATGREQRIGRSGSPEMDSPVEFFCAFDYEADLFRFERDVPAIRRNPEKEEKARVEREKGLYIRTPKYSLHWTHEQSDMVKRQNVDAKPPRPATPFDVRSLGLAFSLDVHVSFPKQTRALSEDEVVEVAEEAQGICRVLWETDQPGTFVTAWFDQQQGHSPIRVEVRVGDLADLPAAPLQRAKTTWTNISDVWVPRTFLSQYFDIDGELRSKVEVAFQWESVNEPVPEKLFTAAGMGLPPETRLVSYETGKPVVLGSVGSE